MDASSNRIEQFFHEHCDPNGWNFISCGLRNGDLFFALTLMREFRATRSRGAPIRFFVESDGHARIASLFAYAIDSCEYIPYLSSFSNQELNAWCEATGRGQFQVGSILRLQPYAFSHPQFAISGLVQHGGGTFSFIELQKLVLTLPFLAAPSLPRISESAREATYRRFAELGFPVGHTLVIFPYAQSLRFDAIPELAAIVRQAQQRDLTVCSAVHGTEEPVPGSVPVSVSFDTLIPFCEAAGHVLALRSGIGDMIASSNAKKFYLYPNMNEYFHSATNTYGMYDCNGSADFNRCRTIGSEAFATEVLDQLDRPRFSAADQFVPPMIRGLFALLRRDDPATGFGVDDRFVFSASGQAVFGRYRFFGGAVLAEGWSSPEDWGIWSAGFRSALFIRIPEHIRTTVADRVRLELDVRFSISEGNPVLNCEIDINGRIFPYLAVSPEHRSLMAFEITETDRQAGAIRVIFNMENPASPRVVSQGVNDDDRLLGIGLVRARFAVVWG